MCYNSPCSDYPVGGSARRKTDKPNQSSPRARYGCRCSSLGPARFGIWSTTEEHQVRSVFLTTSTTAAAIYSWPAAFGCPPSLLDECAVTDIAASRHPWRQLGVEREARDPANVRDDSCTRGSASPRDQRARDKSSRYREPRSLRNRACATARSRKPRARQGDASRSRLGTRLRLPATRYASNDRPEVIEHRGAIREVDSNAPRGSPRTGHAEVCDRLRIMCAIPARVLLDERLDGCGRDGTVAGGHDHGQSLRCIALGHGSAMQQVQEFRRASRPVTVRWPSTKPFVGRAGLEPATQGL